jgi:transposase InsO family protein
MVATRCQELINAMQSQYSIKQLSRVFAIAESNHYQRAKRQSGVRAQADRTLAEEIKAEFQRSRACYGSRRIRQLLRRHGKTRISRLLRQLGLRAKCKRRYQPTTTDSNHAHPIAANWLKKVPAPDRPNQIWTSDITYVPTKEGWLYLAGTLDLCARKCVGWQVADHMETSLALKALHKACQQQAPDAGLIHHSDRGGQYASLDFGSFLKERRITPSMSRKGNCYDNATMESFWATLKTECFGRHIPDTKQEANLLIFDYIEGFYNTHRLHSNLGYQSPLAFEQSLIHNLNY